MISKNTNGRSPEISVDTTTPGAPEEPKDRSYYPVLQKQLDRTYDHISRYLLSQGLLDEEAREEEESLLETASFSGRPVEDVLREDFQVISQLLDEINERVWARVKLYFVFCLFFLLLCNAVWYLSPLHRHADDSIVTAVFWALPKAPLYTGWIVVVNIFWIRRCRSMVLDLETKLREGALLPEDRKKLQAKSWQALGSQFTKLDEKQAV